MSENAFDIRPGWGDPGRARAEHEKVWLHVPALRSIRVVLLSEEPAHYRGHYAQGRMHPCVRGSCPFCLRRLGWQVRYVFSVFDLVLRGRYLLEVGSYTADQLHDMGKEKRQVRGLVVDLYKKGQQERGRIEVDFIERFPDLSSLAPSHDILRECELQWMLADRSV